MKKAEKVLRRFMVVGLFTITLLSLHSESNASLLMDYSIDASKPSASIYYNNANDNFLHGNNLAVRQITGFDTPSNSGFDNALSVFDGTLNFISGALQSKSSNQLNFGPGGSLVVYGGVNSLGIAANSSLLNGTFSSFCITKYQQDLFRFDIIGAMFSGSANKTINNYFAIPGSTEINGGINLSFISTADSGNSFSSANIGSGDIISTPASTPIPAAAILLVSGLTAIASIRRTME